MSPLVCRRRAELLCASLVSSTRGKPSPQAQPRKTTLLRWLPQPTSRGTCGRELALSLSRTPRQGRGPGAGALATPPPPPSTIRRPEASPFRQTSKFGCWRWIRKISGSPTTTIKLGTTSGGSELGSATASTSWSQATLTAVSDPAPRTLYLSFSHSCSGVLNQYSYLDAFQIDYVPNGPTISTLLYLDQSWSPNVGAPTLHEGDNTAGQLVDPSEFWGDDRMYVGSFSGLCEYGVAPLNIDRTLQVRLTPIHFGESMAAPTLPVVPWPANRYP